MSRKQFVLLPLVSLLVATSVFGSKLAARVNGQVILETEVLLEAERLHESHGQALQRLILFRLALEDARREKLNEIPEVRRETDKILYRAYLSRSLETASHDLRPSDSEVRRLYDSAPLVRIRHLALFARTAPERERASAAMATLQKRLREGADFKDLVLRYSQDESKKVGGDLDYRGVDELPADLYAAALVLKQGEVSAPVSTRDGLHLIQLLHRKAFPDAPAVYTEYLRGKLRARSEELFLEERLANLRKKARIEVFVGKDAS